MTAGFEAFVAAHGVALTRFAYVLCGDRHLAEDLVQTVLERCYRRWAAVGMAEHPVAYVKRAIANEYASSRRRASTRETLVAGPEAVAVLEDADAAADRDEMWQALARLSASHRAVLILRYYEDLDDAAIGQVLGCARATVRSTVSRALTALRLDPVITGRHPG